MAGCDHVKGSKRGRSRARIFRARQHSVCLSTSRPSEQTQSSALTCRATTTVSGKGHADQAKRGQSSAVTFRDRQHRGWLFPRRPMEQWPERPPHLTCPPLQWLPESTSTELTEAIAALTQVVSASTVVGCAHVYQANRVLSALTCRSRHPSVWLTFRRP